MPKKSQIGVFILLGIILLIGFSFTIYIRNGKAGSADMEKVSKLPFEFEPIKSYIESCIENTGRQAVSAIGPRGGYLRLPKYPIKEPINAAYYFLMDRDVMPSKRMIEIELSEYVSEELFFCIRNFEDFKEMGFEFEQGDANAKTTINPDNVLFNVGFPLRVRKGSSEIRVDFFSKSVNNVRLGTIYDVSRETINEQMKDFDSICLSCMINLAIENDLHVDLQRLDNSTILFTITDNNTIIDGVPYKLVFANKYREVSCRNVPAEWPAERIGQFLVDCAKSQIEGYNYRLQIEGIPDLEAKANEEFAYDANAAGAGVNFSDYTDLFDINKTTGLIKFIPDENDAGEHIVWVGASDSLGNEDYESFKLKIKSGKDES